MTEPKLPKGSWCIHAAAKLNKKYGPTSKAVVNAIDTAVETVMECLEQVGWIRPDTLGGYLHRHEPGEEQEPAHSTCQPVYLAKERP